MVNIIEITEFEAPELGAIWGRSFPALLCILESTI